LHDWEDYASVPGSLKSGDSPDEIESYLANEFTGNDTKFQHEVRRLRKQMLWAKKGHYSQIHAAESEIRELKRRWLRKMIQRKVPRNSGIRG
jgi:hypothetical protein